MQKRNIAHKATWPQRQRGLSMMGWLLVAGLVGFGVTLALQLGQHYIDFRIVQSTLDKLPPGDVHQMSRTKLREHFTKQFRINNFRIPVREMMEIERDRDQTILKVYYEVRDDLFLNADIVLVFEDERSYR